MLRARWRPPKSGTDAKGSEDTCATGSAGLGVGGRDQSRGVDLLLGHSGPAQDAPVRHDERLRWDGHLFSFFRRVHPLGELLGELFSVGGGDVEGLRTVSDVTARSRRPSPLRSTKSSPATSPSTG